jgi:hypothetical protein
VRIKDAERAAARALLLDPETGLANELGMSLAASTAAGAAVAVAGAGREGGGAETLGLGKGKGRLMTPDEKRRVVEALTAAQTAEEVRRLERMLAEGVIPDDAPEAAAEAAEGEGEGAAEVVVEAEAEAGTGEPANGGETAGEEGMDVEAVAEANGNGQ